MIETWIMKIWIIAIILGIIVAIIGIKQARYKIEKKAILSIFAAYAILLTINLLIAPIIIVQIPPNYYKPIEIIVLVITTILLLLTFRMLYDRYRRHYVKSEVKNK